MSTSHGPALRVYYDGLCPLCSREIDHYRSKDVARDIQWVDITADGFDAAAEGLDPVQVQRLFHVRDRAGRLYVGVEAFIKIWETIPSLQLWKRLSDLPGARSAMQVGYAVFARVRPWLPRRSRADCQDGTCSREFP